MEGLLAKAYKSEGGSSSSDVIYRVMETQTEKFTTEQLDKMKVTLPKGSIVYFSGIPCTLAEDAIIYNLEIATFGIEWACRGVLLKG